MSSEEILDEYDDDKEDVADDDEELEGEFEEDRSENEIVELQETDVNEAKISRCQRRKKKKCLPEQAGLEQEHEDIDGQEDESEKENLEEEEEEVEELEESLSEYDSILSIVSFEWEDEHYEFIDLCDPGTMDNIYSREEGIQWLSTLFAYKCNDNKNDSISNSFQGRNHIFKKVQVNYDIYGKMHYLQECNELRAPPIIRFYNALNTNEVDLTFHGINNTQMKAICTSLDMNQIVEALILKGNPLTSTCCNYLSNLLLKNNTITRLDLSGCRIGPEGAALLAPGLKDNEAVKELNLSRCYIEDEGVKCLVYPLKENYFIEKLILSYNRLGAEAGEALGAILYSNNCIRYLDLDNNNMFDSASVKKLCRGLGFNTSVETISLKWNAMSAVDIGDAISQFLRKNKTTKYLDLSDNRFDSQSFRALKRGIAGSRYIETLRLSRNPVVSEDVEYILPAVKACPSLRLLDLQDIWVRKEFMQASGDLNLFFLINSLAEAVDKGSSLKKVQVSREVEVVVGGVYSNYLIQGPDYPALILKRAQFEAMKPKKSSAKRDLGLFMFTLGDDPLTTDQFMTSMTKFKAKISKELLAELIRQFTIPKTNLVDVAAMRKKYLSLFPDSKPPEQKKQSKGDEEKANINMESVAQEGEGRGKEM